MRVKMGALKTHLTSSSCIAVRRRHPSSSRVVVVYRLCAIYVDGALRSALLRVVVVVSCRCTLSSSSDKADHCFLSKCLDEIYFMRAKVLLLAVLGNLYFDSHSHSLHCSDIPFVLTLCTLNMHVLTYLLT